MVYKILYDRQVGAGWPETGWVGTEEGDPVDLAIRRTGTFENRQIAMVSTPPSRT